MKKLHLFLRLLALLFVSDAALAQRIVTPSTFVPPPNGSMVAAEPRTWQQRAADDLHVADFGARCGVVADQGPAINRAIAYMSYRNRQGTIPPLGHGTGRLRFDACVYHIGTTLQFTPFVNYEGVRATTVESGPIGSVLTSRGTVLRALPELYLNAPTSQGVLIFVSTGDITIRYITLQGTGSINGNPSIGIQWGSTGGTRPHEDPGGTGDTGSFVGGCLTEGLTYYSFTKAWEVNTMGECRHLFNRWETNVTNIEIGGNTVVPSISADLNMELISPTMFGHTIGFQLGNTAVAKAVVRVHGGDMFATGINQTHVLYTSSAERDIAFFGTDFRHAAGGGARSHITLAANYDGGVPIALRTYGATFTNGTISISRGSGTAPARDWEFHGGTMRDVTITTANASRGRFEGVTFNGTTIASTGTTGVTVRGGNVRNVAGTFINLPGGNSGGWLIDTDFESDVVTPIAIFNNITNVDYILRNGRGRGTLAKTADYTLTLADMGRTFTNRGALGTVVFTIPNGAEGRGPITFTKHAAQIVRILPDVTPGNTIYPCAAGKYLEIPMQGGSVTLQGTDTTTWGQISSSGTTPTCEP